ncbi:hypothetical protein ACOBQX_04035 [Actinokineospora sp. G85]|uniref:hypothetical protein n=1 Tax=Actinokineospora sp. G85 TaxID=3406626 RepID=UPI003C71EFAD
MTLRLGAFDAERRWRPAGLATLPSAPGAGADPVSAAMDELLAVTCEPGDVLVTGSDVPPSWVDALAGAGVEFEHRVAPEGGSTVEERLLADPPAELRGRAFAPYAVDSGTAGLVRALDLRPVPPDLGVVRAVSSKSWSNALVGELGLAGAGVVVSSVPELVREVAALDGAPVLVKDPFGVAGRGTLPIASPRVLRSVSRVLAKQVERGARVEVLVQPRFDQVADFSAQFSVRAGGRVDWHGTRLIDNSGFSYTGSRPLSPGLAARLAALGYRAVMTEVGGALADAGYHGPVCVDSMLLRDGTLVPVLEVNPRMSMGLICVLAERGLGRPVRLAVRPAGVRDGFESVARGLGEAGVLLRRGGTGVLPLAAGTLGTARGRLYCAVVARDEAEDRALDAALDSVVARRAA